ncbi:MAG: O-antigen ligase family protein [Pseudomonadota bacterium]
MLQDKTERKLEHLATFGGLLILVSMMLSWEVSRVCYFLLAVVALWMMVRFPARLGRDEKLYIYPILFFFSSALMSYLLNDSPKRGPQILVETFSLLMLSIPLVIFYGRFPPRQIATSTMFVCCVFAATLVSVYDLWSTPHLRAGGSTGQAILFSTIVLGATVVVAACLHQYLKKPYWQFICLCLLIGCGIFTLILTGSRGSWIALPVIAMLFVLFYFRTTVWYKKWAGILLISVVTPIISYQVPYVKQRVDFAVDQTSEIFVDGSGQERKLTSIGIRVALWRAAFEIFQNNPVLGVGPGSYRMVMKKYVADNNVEWQLQNYKHAHNQFLNTLMTKGLVGLIALLVMLTSHTYIFLRHLKHEHPEIRAMAMGGCMIIFSYLILSLTSSPFERKITLVFYGFSLCLLIGRIVFLKKQTEPASRSVETAN